MRFAQISADFISGAKRGPKTGAKIWGGGQKSLYLQHKFCTMNFLRSLSARTDPHGNAEIYLRVNINRSCRFRIKTGISVPAHRFKAGEIIKPRANPKEAAELRAIEYKLAALELRITEICTTTPAALLNKDFVLSAIGAHDNAAAVKSDIEDAFERHARQANVSTLRAKSYNVVLRALLRFERYRKAAGRVGCALSLDCMTADDLNAFTDFLTREHEICCQYPQLYSDDAPGRTRTPQPRGRNTINGNLRCLRALFNWAVATGLTENNPFKNFTGMPAESYGTPYYLTPDERDAIAACDLTARPALEVQRDIFIFHCFVGCRVSDLIRLTADNIINGGLEYIANKTLHTCGNVIRVPLHARALQLVEKYAGADDGRLFPFITPQRYNDAIKEIFTICGITRSVIVRDAVSGREVRRQLNEIASSHIARRTFVGNLYKKVKDPNLVGALSGHKEGSRAFARYRDIDEDIRRDIIGLLD